MTLSSFREQLAWLAKNRTILPLAEFAALHRRRALPADALAVTIDDGYACAGALAAPLLEEHSIPATIFLPVAVIEKGEPFWWDELEEVVLGYDGTTLRVGAEAITLGEKDPNDRHWSPGSPATTPRQAAFHEAHARLSRMRPAQLDEAMDEIRARATLAKPRPPMKRPMSADEVRRAKSALIEFGSHSVSHSWLTELASEELRHEIWDSMDRCHAITGMRPSAFAYPFGAYDEASLRLVTRAGYQCACSTRNVAVSRRSEPFAFPRIQVPNCGAAGLERILARVPAE